MTVKKYTKSYTKIKCIQHVYHLTKKELKKANTEWEQNQSSLNQNIIIKA
jgi:hypothetical protein